MRQVVRLGGTSAQQRRGVLLSLVSGLLSLTDRPEPWVHLTSGWDWTGYASPTLPIRPGLPYYLSLLSPQDGEIRCPSSPAVHVPSNLGSMHVGTEPLCLANCWPGSPIAQVV